MKKIIGRRIKYRGRISTIVDYFEKNELLLLNDDSIVSIDNKEIVWLPENVELIFQKQTGLPSRKRRIGYTNEYVKWLENLVESIFQKQTGLPSRKRRIGYTNEYVKWLENLVESNIIVIDNPILNEDKDNNSLNVPYCNNRDEYYNCVHWENQKTGCLNCKKIFKRIENDTAK